MEILECTIVYIYGFPGCSPAAFSIMNIVIPKCGGHGVQESL